MTEEKRIGVDRFRSEEEDLYGYEIPDAKTKEPLGTMFLRGFKQPALDRYREIRNGTGRGKGDAAKAREYLFKRTYAKFEFTEAGCVIDLGQCKTETEFFLSNCGMVVDAVLIQHLAVVFPDVDEKK